MKVFVTGASGFIGSAVILELLQNGHEVLALARTDAAEAKIAKISPQVKIIRGDIENIEILEKGVKESEGVIHLGFIHDFSNFEECCHIDRRAVDVMCKALEGTSYPFVYTTGTLSLPKGKLATEKDVSDTGFGNIRAQTEKAVFEYKEKGVRVMSIRLAPTVHGEGDKAFVPVLMQIAKKIGVSGYIGNGENVWPAVHRVDAASLYRLVLERGISGHAYHGVTENGIKTKDIATTISKAINVPLVSINPEKAQEQFNFLGFLFGLDNPTSSEITQVELNWKPKNVTLIQDIMSDFYRNSVSI